MERQFTSLSMFIRFIVIWVHSAMFENLQNHKDIRIKTQLQNEFDPIVKITIVTYLNVLLG